MLAETARDLEGLDDAGAAANLRAVQPVVEAQQAAMIACIAATTAATTAAGSSWVDARSAVPLLFSKMPNHGPGTHLYGVNQDCAEASVTYFEQLSEIDPLRTDLPY